MTATIILMLGLENTENMLVRLPSQKAPKKSRVIFRPLWRAESRACVQWGMCCDSSSAFFREGKAENQ